MTGPVIWLADGAAPDIRDVGGKGRGLGVLVEAGLPVPEAFVVPTATHRAAVGGALQERIRDAVSRLAPDGNLEELDAATGGIRRMLVEATATATLSSPQRSLSSR